MAETAQTTAHTEVAEHGGGHAEPSNLGVLTPGVWVALAMLVLIGVALWKRVPGTIGSGLDSSIAEIRKQLDEAKQLRAEAEALRKEYADKIAGAEKDAAAMIDNARREADSIVAKAESDTGEMIVRREKMAQDKISAAERTAVDDLRARAAGAATMAARDLIARNHTADRDQVLINEAIGTL